MRSLIRLKHGELGPLRRLSRAPRTRPLLVSSFDAVRVRAETVDAIAAAFERHGVPFVAVPGARGVTSSFAVAAEDRDAAWDALTRELTGDGWVLPARSSGGLVFRSLAAANGSVLAGAELGCHVEFWTALGPDVPRPDGETHLPGTRVAPRRNGVVGYLTPQAWTAATSSPGHWIRARTPAQLVEMHEPVDLVYTWVDGSDPDWQARKRSYGGDAGAVHSTADHPSRFLSRDELRYSLRSAQMYASWARRVFLVTDGQVPDWLDTTNPRLVVVDHRQIFTDPTALPVFNSHAIESQLHHIPDLSEHYVYLNDDVFFGRPVTPDTFFHGNGIAKFFLSDVTLDVEPASARDLPVLSAAKNNRALIEELFGRTVTAKFRHAPLPQLRSVLVALEQAQPELFARVARSRLRHPDDYSIPSALSHYYAYAIGRAVPGSIVHRYQDIGREDTARRLDGFLRTRDADVFCLNDNASDPDALLAQTGMLREFLDHYFPVPSEFER